MLDLQKLALQLQDIGAEIVSQDDASRVLRAAFTALEDACATPDKFEAKLDRSRGHTFWPLAKPLEAISLVEEVEPITGNHSVVACDGSQIMPTQHEAFNCFLINIGEVVIHYGTGQEPTLASTPHLFHRQEDLYPLIDHRRLHIDEPIISAQRALLELSSARDQALLIARTGRPVCCIVDGSFVAWGIERTPETYQNHYFEQLQQVLDALNAASIPIIGYISHSRSGDLLGGLRVWLCPYSVSQCSTFCGHLHEDEFPCSTVWPLTDRHLLSGKLERNCRSAAFLSDVDWSKQLDERNRIVFIYFHTGQEVARIDLPYWCFTDGRLFDLALQTVLAQSQKGMGYPITLAEAHNLAVIRQADRTQFFDMLSAHLSEIGQQAIRVSPKEARKRRSIV